MDPQAPDAPTPRPRIFISAVSKEFATLRRTLDELVRKLGCEPETQAIFGTEPGDLRALLRDKIDSCKGLIQIVGDGYGAEPPDPDPQFGRVSYTQYELLYARAQGKTTWLFPAEPGVERDTPVDRLDQPRDPGHPDPDGYQAERRALQADYRARVVEGSGHLRHRFACTADLKTLVGDLRGHVAPWFEEVRGFHRQVQADQRRTLRRLGWVLGALALVVLVGVGAFYALHRGGQGQTERLLEAQQETAATLTQQLSDLDTQKALAQARAGRDYRAALAQALALPAADRRQAEVARLEAEHRYRLESIDRLFELLRTGYAQGGISAIAAEFQRLLNAPDGGIDPALAYLQGQVPDVLAQARRLLERRDEAQRQARTALNSLLIAAAAAEAEDRPAQAAQLYDQALGADPGWPEALEAATWFHARRSDFERDHGSLAEALTQARRALDLAGRLQRSPGAATGQRLGAVAEATLADGLALRGQPGDLDATLAGYGRALAAFEARLATEPQSQEAARDVSLSLDRLGATS